jgi:hypothetical protein
MATGRRAKVPGRRLTRRIQVGAAAAALGLTVVLAQQPVHGAFTAGSGSTGNQVTTAATFCTTPGTATVTASADSWVNEANAARTAGGADYYVQVVSNSPAANGRVYVRFPLPPFSARCTVSSATLKLYTDSPDAGRTIGVYRADPAAPVWTEAALNWTNRPGTVGTAATAATVAANGYLSWTVTAHVQALYAGPDNGLVLRDEAEGSATSFRQQYMARQATYPPQLVVVWD